MTLTTTTHLNVSGQAREALEFYASVFGGETTIATYAQFGMPADSPHASKVVFGQVLSDNGFRIAGYDVPAQDGPVRTPSTQRVHETTLTAEDVFVAVRGESLEEVRGHWDAPSSRGPSSRGPSSRGPSSRRSRRRSGAPASGCSPTGSA